MNLLEVGLCFLSLFVRIFGQISLNEHNELGRKEAILSSEWTVQEGHDTETEKSHIQELTSYQDFVIVEMSLHGNPVYKRRRKIHNTH